MQSYSNFNHETRAYAPTSTTYGTHVVGVTDTTASGWAGFRLIADTTLAVNTSVTFNQLKTAVS